MRKVSKLIGTLVETAARKNVDSASIIYCYQPRIPEKLLKEREEKKTK